MSEYENIVEIWNKLGEYVAGFLFNEKGEVVNCYKLLLKLYSKIYSERVRISKALRTYELKREDFEKSSREYVMKGFAADEREKLRNISMPSSVKEDYDKLASLTEYVDGCKKIERILEAVWQNFVLDYKLSGMAN